MVQSKPMGGSLPKHLNALKNGYSYILSNISGKPIIKGMPPAIGIELTTQCNLKCPECTSGGGFLTRPLGFMDLKLYEKIITELRPFLYNINLYFQGEPMLHPLFFRFLEMGSDLPVTVSTNGHFLNDDNSEKLAVSRLKTLVISLDGMDAETYSIYRKGGDFSKVMAGITELAGKIRGRKSSLQLEIQFLVNRHNENHVDRARQFAKSVNANFRLKSMQVINSESVADWMPEEEKFRRYTLSGNSYRIKSRLKNSCFRLWTNPVITWDGKVVPCCFDKDAEYVMGDLTEMSFREIWNGDKFRQFRKNILKGRSEIEICRNCTSGLKNTAF